MAKYYFHLRDGLGLLRDPEGIDLAVPDSLPALALHQALSILSHDVLDGEIDLAQTIEVADEADGIVHRLHFVDALAIRGAA